MGNSRNVENFPNLFNIPDHAPEEVVNVFVKTQNVKIERIVSYGQITPKKTPYVQDQNELVFVIQGSATLKIETEIISLKAGNSVLIPKGCKHWVTSTSSKPPVIWLCIHYSKAVDQE